MDNTPEKRCCDECGHSGTDGGSTRESYCAACGETVPYPTDDLCPECGATNCMMIACPECGGRYSLDEERGDDIETPNAIVQAPPLAAVACNAGLAGFEYKRRKK